MLDYVTKGSELQKIPTICLIKMVAEKDIFLD